MFGFLAALFGCLATSTKTILAESLLHGYKFDRYNLICSVSSWLCVNLSNSYAFMALFLFFLVNLFSFEH